jgi:predicted amino acid-binding ACT domain protein
MDRTNATGFSWASKQLVVDTLEASAAEGAFKEAAASKFLDSVRGELGASGDAEDEERAIMDRFLDFLEPPRGSIKELPKGQPVTSDEFKTFLDQLRSFNTEAGLNARAHYRSRFAVTFVGPDRVGVLAELTGRLGRLGCVIEGATMVVVAGQVATMLVISAPNLLRQFQVDEALADFPTTLFAENRRLAAPPYVAQLRWREPEWPRRGSTGWHVYAELPDRSGTLAAITEVIAGHNVPLTSFATWISKRRSCVLDLNYAVQPEANEDSIAAEVRDVLAKLAATEVRLYPSSRPVHSRADQFLPPNPARAIVLTVVGRAVPGLVANVTKGLSEPVVGRPGFNIVGSAMAILQDHTALALVIEGDRAVDDPLLNEARLAASRYLDPASFEASVGSTFPLIQVSERTRPPTQPTHHLRCVAPEEGGVLATLAEAVASADANIVWVMARVIDQRVNASTVSVCEVKLDLSVPLRRRSKLDDRITRLRGSTGWQIDLSRWGSEYDD